jgi:hypothetical protein
MRVNDQDNARYRDHDIVFIEPSVVRTTIGGARRRRRSKPIDYKSASRVPGTACKRARFIAGISSTFIGIKPR